MDVRRLVAELVSFGQHRNELPIQLFLRDRLVELGFETELQEVYAGRPNLVARRGHGGPLLNTHVDVFPPYEHPSPFAVREEGDLLIGRGVCDTKGQIAALLAALEGSEGPCQVALTVDEEQRGLGSERLALSAEGAVVLEPTALALAVAEAGFIEVEVETDGRPAHGTIPERGENAISKALTLYEAITRLPFMRANHPLFPRPWANLGLIEGGAEPGVVPFRCRFTADLAVLPGVGCPDAIGQVEGTVQCAGGRVRTLDSDPGFETALDAKVVRVVRAAVAHVTERPAVLAGMRSWTDAANLVAKGIPCVVIGAGELAVAHSDHEVVSLADLAPLTQILIGVIDRW